MQVGHKSFRYMDLYAEAELALVETPYREIQFKQIVGDFQALQGKIIVQHDSPLQVYTHPFQQRVYKMLSILSVAMEAYREV